MITDRNNPFGKIPPEIEVVKIIIRNEVEEIYSSSKFPIQDFVFPLKPQSLSIGQEISVFKQKYTIRDIQIQIESDTNRQDSIKTLIINLSV